MPDPTKDLVRLVIAEAPGAEESEKGEPLVGGSGRLFNKLIAAAGIQREGLTIANCIQCKPPGNVFPTDPAARTYISKSDAEEAIKHCKRSHVDPLLTSRKWNRVDMFGDKPLRIVGGQGGGIGTWRGSPVTLPNGLRGIATYHPSYLMRDQSLIPVAINDLKKSLNEPPEFYRPYPDLDEVRGFKATRFSFDIECPKYRTMGDAAPAEMVGLCSASGFAICVPIRGEYTVELKRIFSNATEVIGHNCLQFDLPRLRRVDIKISEQCVVYDTMLLQHLLFPDLPHDLEFVGSQFISKPAWKADKSRGWEPYCCRDTDVTFQVWQHLYPMLKKEKLDQLYFNVAVPMAKICLLMHETGFKVDTNQIKFVRAKLLKEMEREEHNIPVSLRTHSEPIRVRQLAPIGTLGKSGKPVKYIHVPSSKQVVPWRSSAVKQRYFYSKDEGCLGLDPVLDPKTGNVTTGKIAIAKLYSRTKNDSIRALGLLNKLDETITTFAKEEMVSISRMYPHFNVHGTACLVPGTRVCTGDLKWVPIENVRQGDVLIGFDEQGIWRKLKPSVVEHTETHFLDAYRLVIAGKEIIASEDHGWLVETKRRPKGQGRFVWRHTRDLKPGDRLAAWHEPWTYRRSRDAGYLSGIIDGEGSQNIAGSLYVTQKENACLKEIRSALKREQIPFTDLDTKDRKKPEIKALYIPDGIKIVGSLRPARLIAKCQRVWEGKTPYNKTKMYATLDRIEAIGKRVVIGLKTTTQTFMAEGFLSHNSGRLSSSDPNLQNIPESARIIYVPSHVGWKIVDVDYSQIENRLTAYFAADRERAKRFTDDPNFSEHKYAASLFLNIPYEDVVKDNDKDAPYGKAKRIVHGTNYGMGYKKICNLYDLDLADTRRLQDTWKNAIRPTILWQSRTGEKAKHDGFLTTPFSRKRWFWTSSYYTEALSFLPQSTAADVIFRAMIGLMYERIGLSKSHAERVCPLVEALPHPARLLIQVHDSLIFECPVAQVDSLVALVTRVMCQPWPELGGMSIPIGVKVGDNWGESD